MLYPDNPDHEKAIDILDLWDNALYIKHIAKYDEEGNLKNKEHYHCVVRYDDGYWLSKLLSDLGLPKTDGHLFHSYTDFKIGKKQRFKSLEDYVDYLDHQLEENKPDKYSLEDFHGGLKSLAEKVIKNRDLERYLQLFNLCQFIQDYSLDHFQEVRYFTFKDWYRVCIDAGFGELFYKEWYKMRDILSAYIIK